jgi:IS5 family transposase
MRATNIVVQDQRDGMKQTTFASAAWDRKGKVTRRERFLTEMDAVIPWTQLLGLIEPHYPKVGNGTQPMPMERMLRIYFMQNWFNLSDPAAEDALYDSESMRRFAGIELVEDAVPDESTILRFRHLLEQHQLTERIFAEIRSLLEHKRLLLKSGTIVDATIIAAPPSTKNSQGARDPDMRQTRKGKDWHFGMKAHIGTDRRGIVHSLSTTAANVHDSTQMPKLLHGDEREVFGDQAYWNESHRQSAQAVGIRYRINRRPVRNRPLSRHERYINRQRSGARARVEHVFHVVKRLWGFSKVRYRGLAKNTARLYTAFALANLYLLRRRLLSPQGTCAW